MSLLTKTLGNFIPCDENTDGVDSNTFSLDQNSFALILFFFLTMSSLGRTSGRVIPSQPSDTYKKLSSSCKSKPWLIGNGPKQICIGALEYML